MTNEHLQVKDSIESFDFCESELVIGLVYAVGTDYKPVVEAVEATLRARGYTPNLVRISDLIGTMTTQLDDSSEIGRITSRMNAGNTLCRKSKRLDLWALTAIAEINKRRSEKARQLSLLEQSGLGLVLQRNAHIVSSLKRPQEVSTLRKVYGDGFFAVGVFATEKERLDSLIEKNAPKHDAINLIKRDAEENDDFGQKTRETFQLADVFVQLKKQAYKQELERFFDLVFSDPYVTPTQQEHAMFLAYATALRSGQLGRQVGAAITSKRGDVLAVGCNDVPRPGGGLYWPDLEDRRDHILGYDSNDGQRNAMVDKVLQHLQEAKKKEIDLLRSKLGGRLSADETEELLASTQVETAEEKAILRKGVRDSLDVTEYGRAVHAEMDALLTCARSGVSPTGGILYTTTFPCHNCTRHIIAAGIERVIYIEPYAKSRSEELHDDAIVVEEKTLTHMKGVNRRLPFTHFVGVGPRRYFDLFSMSLSSGHELIRKVSGKTLKIHRANGWPRIPLSPFTYIQREALAVRELDFVPNDSATATDRQEVDHGSDEEQINSAVS